MKRLIPVLALLAAAGAAWTGYAVAQPAVTSGGCQPYSYICTGASNQDAQVIKGSGGQLYAIAAFNVATSVRYLKIYNLASGATSASTPVLRYLVPPSNSGVAINVPVGIAFDTGISFRVSTGQADNDTGAVTSGDVVVTVAFK